MKVKVIGIGGIGGRLLPTLCMYLNYSMSEKVIVTLVDGDKYESTNRSRQTFDKIGNKADVTKERIEKDNTRIEFKSMPVFVTENNVSKIIRSGDIVFSCVDNHATRKVLSDRCEDVDNIVLISGGNDFTDGNVQIHIKKEGKDLTRPIANCYHPELVDPQDVNPGNASCEELAQEGSPQLIMANNMAAAIMLNVFYAIITGMAVGEEVYFDVPTVETRIANR